MPWTRDPETKRGWGILQFPNAGTLVRVSTLISSSSVLLGRTSPDARHRNITLAKMAPEIDHEEDYVSEEDTDFAPDNAPAEDSSASDDDEEAEADKPSPAKRKRQSGDNDVEDAGFENSGDEAIIEKGKKRQKKPRRKDGAEADEDTGEGGLIKTRRMRAVEYAAFALPATDDSLTDSLPAERPKDEQKPPAGRLPSTWMRSGHK